MMTTTLVVGLGNPILTDDAVGVRLARDLHLALCERPGLAWLEECSVGGLNLLDVLQGHDRLVCLDSVKTTDAQPGAWHHFTASALRPTMNLSNVHDTNFATALELGRRLGLRLPPDEEIHIFAVEIADNLTFSERMTEALEARYPAVRDAILAEVRDLLATDG
jgi:hydrogenase maturation protease